MKILTVTALLVSILLPAGVAKGYRIPVGDDPFVVTCTKHNDKVNVRSGPGKNYRVVRQLKSGSYVVRVSKKTGRDGLLWHKYEHKNDRTSGWIRDDYLCAVPSD
jgi:uncharacterized protein YgiM (DUF1202 family)